MSNSYPYLPTPMPGVDTLRDMVLWFATPKVRSELMFLMVNEPDDPTIDDLVASCRTRIQNWAPTTDLEYSYYQSRRHQDWLVWSTVNELDEAMVVAYTQTDETFGDSPLERWGIEISTLPVYGGLPASPRLQDTDEVPAIDWNERHN